MADETLPKTQKIICPTCGRKGEFQDLVEDAETGEIDLVTFVPPEGFRKVQIGWNADRVQLCCVSCGVPSILYTGTH